MFKLFLAFCCCAFLAVQAIPEAEAVAAANALLELSVALQQQAAAQCQADNGGQPCRRRAFALNPLLGVNPSRFTRSVDASAVPADFASIAKEAEALKATIAGYAPVAAPAAPAV